MESVLALSIYEDGDENLKEGTNQLPSTTRATAGAVAGLDAAKDRARALVESACDALTVYGDDAETLREAARFVIARKS